MNTIKFLSEQNLNDIKEFIKIEFLKRGITANITNLEEIIPLNNSIHRLKLETDEFQTTPVLFRSLKMLDFGSAIKKIEFSDKKFEQKGNCFEIYLSIHYYYNHFDGGSNSCRAFGLTFRVFGSDMFDTHLYEIKP